MVLPGSSEGMAPTGMYGLMCGMSTHVSRSPPNTIPPWPLLG